jgi:hypothetical protein
MIHFRAFEMKALRLLGDATLGAVAVEAVCRDAEFVSYKYSGVGYFLTVRHHLLPTTRVVLDQPIVVGEVGDVTGSYLAFVQDNELMLEYAATTDVPENFRDLPVRVELQGGAT